MNMALRSLPISRVLARGFCRSGTLNDQARPLVEITTVARPALVATRQEFERQIFARFRLGAIEMLAYYTYTKAMAHGLTVESYRKFVDSINHLSPSDEGAKLKSYFSKQSPNYVLKNLDIKEKHSLIKELCDQQSSQLEVLDSLCDQDVNNRLLLLLEEAETKGLLNPPPPTLHKLARVEAFRSVLKSWETQPPRFQCDFYIKCPDEQENCSTLGGLLKGVLEDVAIVPDTAANRRVPMGRWQDVPTSGKWVLCEITESPELIANKLFQLERSLSHLACLEDDPRPQDIGAVMILVNGERDQFLEYQSKIVIHPDMHIAKYPFLVGWTPYRNVYFAIDQLRTDMDSKFDAIDGKFDQLRTDMDSKFDAIDGKFDAMNSNFDQLRTDMNNRLTSMEKTIASLLQLMQSKSQQ